MAPTISAYAEVANWHTAQTTATTGSISWNAGDVIVAMFAVEGDTFGTPTLPTATGLTFTTIDVNSAAGTCLARTAYAVAGSSGSGTVSSTITLSAQFGGAAWVISNATGIGDHKIQATSGKTVSSTAQGVGSVYLWGSFDFGAGTVGTPTPTPTTTRENSTGNYTTVVADLQNGGSGSYGITGGGTGPFTTTAIEVVGAVGASPTYFRREGPRFVRN